MKAVGVISTTVLFLLIGSAVPAYAQDEHQDEKAKPAQQEEKSKPAQHEEQAKPAKQEEKAKPEEQAKPEEHQAEAKKQESAAKPAKQEQQAKPAKQEQKAQTEKEQSSAKQVKQQQEAKPEKQQEQAQSNNHQRPERSASDEKRQRAEPALRLSARGEGRIPDDRFRANFGEEHTFVINQPVMVGGFSRFQYGGFWFGFVNPWPVGWYYTDNVYVDYIDGGYYLCNPYYPSARLSISVVM
ncbi:MAG: cell envelope integrity protein TolA [Candidatus Acidiferrales bacterium]